MLNFQKFYFWYNNNLPLTVTDDMSVLETLYRLINEFNDVLEETETQFNALETDVHETYQKWEERFQTFTTDLWDKFNEYKDLIDTEIETFESKINTQYEDLTGQWNQTKTDWESYKDSMTAWKNQADAEIQKSLSDMNTLYTNVNAFYSNIQTGWTQIQTEFAGMKSEWQAFHASVEMVIDGFQKDLDEMSGRVTANEADIALLKKSVSGDNKALSSLIDTVGVRPTEFTGTVWDEIDQNHNDYESLGNALTEHENAQSQINATVNTEISTIKNNAMNFQNQYNGTLPILYKDLSSKLSELPATIENLTALNESGYYIFNKASSPADNPVNLSSYSDSVYELFEYFYELNNFDIQKVIIHDPVAGEDAANAEVWERLKAKGNTAWGSWTKLDFGGSGGTPSDLQDYVKGFNTVSDFATLFNQNFSVASDGANALNLHDLFDNSPYQIEIFTIKDNDRQNQIAMGINRINNSYELLYRVKISDTNLTEWVKLKNFFNQGLVTAQNLNISDFSLSWTTGDTTLNKESTIVNMPVSRTTYILTGVYTVIYNGGLDIAIPIISIINSVANITLYKKEPVIVTQNTNKITESFCVTFQTFETAKNIVFRVQGMSNLTVNVTNLVITNTSF